MSNILFSILQRGNICNNSLQKEIYYKSKDNSILIQRCVKRIYNL